MNKIIYCLIAVIMWPAATAFAQLRTIDQRVDSLIALMTLEEKAGQLNQYSGRELTGPASARKSNMLNDIKQGWVGSVLNVKSVKDTREIQAQALQSRLKIPLLFGLDVIHGYKTVFPIPLAEAASWDPDLMRRTAHVAATEAAASGIHWTFAPMVDVARDARWGRVMEGAGEDTYLGSLIAAARVKGFQGEQLGSTDAIMACAKHFAAYGAAEAGRDYNVVDMSERQLFETYLPPFEAAAKAGVATFMNSFNTLNGIPATGNAWLQRDILKGKWAFDGFIVSDWGSIGEMIPWGFAANRADAALKAITAGSDMDMESDAYRNHLVQLVKDGKVPLSFVDDAVKRVLTKKFELGLFDDPYKFSSPEREANVMNDPRYKAIAREAAQKSIVLLKNTNNLLPLHKNYKTIALIGPLAKSKKDLLGSWVVFPNDTAAVVSIWEGIKEEAGKTKLLYAAGASSDGAGDAAFAAAIATARQADLVLFIAGETGGMSGEAKSRTDIHLPGRQEELFARIKATGKPVVAVIMGGRPLIFNTIADQANAILYAWWPGNEGGHAIADVLYGKYNPAGKLPMSFPRAIGQLPMSYNYYNTGRPVKKPGDTKYKSAYIDELNTPRFAFGYGLSYTVFDYSNLVMNKTSITENDTVHISFTVTNKGKHSGEEVAQLYSWDKVAAVARPVKELKGFEKLSLKPGESKTVHFRITKQELSFYDAQLNWIAEPGEFSIMIGSASDDIRLEAKLVLLPSAAVATTQAPADTAFHVYLLIGQSNMAGRGALDSLSKAWNPRILMLNKNNIWEPATDPVHFDKPKVIGVGPAISFAEDMIREDTAIKIGLVPCAWGGSPIRVWEPDSVYLQAHPYDDAVRRTKAALRQGVLKGILWHQGESDNNPAAMAVYMEKLQRLINRLRTEFALPSLPFVAGEIGTFKKAQPINEVINSLPLTTPHTAVVSAAGLKDKGDNTHFDTPSARELGKRYAEAMKKLQQ